MIRVLQVSGKGESNDYVSIHEFEIVKEATDFIKAQDKAGKYWTECVIIEPDQVVDLSIIKED